MSPNRVYLNVPYAEKDAAKHLGAKWNAEVKRWFISSELPTEPFAQWLSKTQASQGLTIELVPKTCWFSNVRSEVSTQAWELLKKQTYQSASHRCEICGGQGNRHPVECHEVWDYDDNKGIQTLIRLIALCPACHECKHIGFANSRGRGEIAAAHLARVNQWSIEQTTDYIEQCFELWQYRSQFDWDLDISYLKLLGVEVLRL